MTTRRRLTPAIADVRRAVRESLAVLGAADVRVADAEVTGSSGAEAVAGARAGGAATHLQMRPLATNAPARPGAIAANGRKRSAGAPEVSGDAPEQSTDARAQTVVLVALSGGADSLALAAATAFEAPRAGVRAGAVIVDHGLQEGSAEVAERAAAQARELGLDPVLVRRVGVGAAGGPEAAAREARYAALAAAASEAGATVVLLGHTLDDQAETVILGLARGSGAASLSGMASVTPATGQMHPLATNAPGRPDANAARGRNQPADGATAGAGVTTEAVTTEAVTTSLVYARPMLGIRRATTLQFCVDSGLTPWHDPQNADPAFARVRVRESVLPLLERELGPGIAEALARTADQSREDAEALDHFAEEQAEELADHAEAGLSLSVGGLALNPAALRQRIIRLAVSAEFGVSLSRAQTLEVARLVTDWRGQGVLHLPGVRVVRQGGLIVFSAAEGGVQARG